MHINANLRWLRGYPLGSGPDGVRWRCLGGREDPEAEIVLDGHALHLATQAHNKLISRFPRALPAVVGDVEAWSAGVLAVVEQLKGPIHRSAELTAPWKSLPQKVRRKATSVLDERLGLEPLFDALCWAYLSRPSGLLDVLKEVARLPLLERLTLDLQIRMLGLSSRHSTELVVPLMRDLIAFERLPGATHGCEEWRKLMCSRVAGKTFGKSTWKGIPDPPLPDNDLCSLREWTKRILSVKLNDERRLLRLYANLRPNGLGPWHHWWVHALQVADRARAGDWTHVDMPADRRLAIQQRVRHISSPPRDLKFVDFLTEIDSLGSKRGEVIAAAAERLPAGLPNIERFRLLKVWRHTHPGWITAVSTWCSAHPVLAKRLLGGGDWTSIFTDWPEREHWQGALRAWELLGGHLSANSALSAGLWIEGGASVERAAALGHWDAENKGNSEWLADGVRQLCLHLGGSPESVFGLIERVGTCREDLAQKNLRAICSFEREDADTLAEHLMEAGDGVLTSVLPKLDFLEGEAPAIPRRESAVVWPDSYPDDLSPALERLAAYHPEPASAAHRILKVNFPNSSELRTELRSIEDRLGDSPALLQRANALRRRLEGKAVVSRSRLENLKVKLHKAATKAAIEGWQAEIDRRYQETMKARIPGELCPTPSNEFLERSLPYLLALPRDSRDLGLQILADRASRPPPWDLREHPANKRYLEGRTQAGLDLDPWLSTFEMKSGDLTLAFEDDPYEILWMGAHFQTCLSPWGFNFFSVVSVLADINKRVVYARNAKGKVVGRCLLALDRTGQLIPFHRYHHDADGFPEMVTSFVEKLCSAMGTWSGDRGEVPTLVASRWYDDGPHALDILTPAFLPGSMFRSRLRTVAPGALLELLDQQFPTEALFQLSIPRLVALTEIRSRPELVAEMVPLFERMDRTGATRVAVAELLYEAGLPDEARRVLKNSRLLIATELMPTLVEVDPSFAIRLLRQQSDRMYVEERDAWIAAAWLRLHRVRKAVAVLESLAGESTQSAHARKLAKRLLFEHNNRQE